MPLRKAKRIRGATRTGTIKGTTRTGKIVMVALGVAAAAALIAAGQPPSQSANLAAVEAQPQRAAAVALDRTSTKTAAPAPKRAPVTRPRATQTAKSRPVVTTAATTGVVAAAAKPATASASNAVMQEPATVTITGCLEDDDGTFVLKQTSGAEAPKSRSWKSGFLKKSSASIVVIDAANRLRLPTHVGQRVSLTGMLVDREMRARLLQPVAGESCH